jgi:hypothetical protein
MGRSYQFRELVDRLHDDEYLKRTINLLAKARVKDWKNILEKAPGLRPEGVQVKRIKQTQLIR